jgi:tryptophan synthase alpha chain
MDSTTPWQCSLRSTLASWLASQIFYLKLGISLDKELPSHMASDRIREAFEKAKSEGRIALVPYATVGFPELGLTTDIVRSLVDAGADIIELGVPFSDPLGDGPTVQASGHRALQNGVTPEFCIDTAKEIRAAGIEVPLIFMGYYNNILTMGLDEYCTRASEAGVDGLICPDLPAAEAGPLQDSCDSAGLVLIPLVVLTSSERSIEHACERAGGFIYCVSVLGVTGARATMSERVEGLANKIRGFTDLPVAVGFGISTPDHVAAVAKFGDGAIVGSALINALADGNAAGAAERGGTYIRSLVPGTPRKVMAN